VTSLQISYHFSMFSDTHATMTLECCAALWYTPALLQQLPPTSLCIHGSRECKNLFRTPPRWISHTRAAPVTTTFFYTKFFSYEILSIAIYGIISLHISLHYSQSSLATLKLGVASSRVALQLWLLSLHGWIGCCHTWPHYHSPDAEHLPTGTPVCGSAVETDH